MLSRNGQHQQDHDDQPWPSCWRLNTSAKGVTAASGTIKERR
jgi:hypothetical protein